MAGETILIVDDEINIIKLVKLYLEREGFQVKSAMDGREALQSVKQLQPSIIILDIMLPEMDGLEVCRQLRSTNQDLAIIMLTARDDDIDKILGLELGADDYLTKPFNPRELVARVKAVMRRQDRSRAFDTEKILRYGDMEVDEYRREARIKGVGIDLRTQEFEVLLALIQNPGRVLTREKLLNIAWGYNFAGETRTVDVHVAQLRKKLVSSQVKIVTVTGIGYKLAA